MGVDSGRWADAAMVRRAVCGLVGWWKARLLVAKPRESRGKQGAARSAGVVTLMAAIFMRTRRRITSEVDREVWFRCR